MDKGKEKGGKKNGYPRLRELMQQGTQDGTTKHNLLYQRGQQAHSHKAQGMAQHRRKLLLNDIGQRRHHLLQPCTGDDKS